MDDVPDTSQNQVSVEQLVRKRPRRTKNGRRRKAQADSTQSESTKEPQDMEMRDLSPTPSEATMDPTPDESVSITPMPDPKEPGETEKRWHWTARVPGQVLPTVVGPVGLGLCWNKMSIVWGGNQTLHRVSLVILGWTVFQMTCLLLLMVYRLIRYPSISILEQKHPTHFIFGILVTLYPCLISSFIINWNQTVASVFWYIGFGAMCLFMIYCASRFVAEKIPVAQLNPFYLFGPLPILLAIQLAPYAPKDLLFFGWSAGTLWYFALHVLLVFRWAHIGLPSKRDRAAMWLTLAASADSALGYVAASPNGFGEVAKTIFFFSLLQFAVLLVLSHKIFASGFVAAWWMTTLPSTAFSSSWLVYGMSIKNQGVIITGTVFAGLATLWILSLYILTAIWIIRKDFWPKSPYRPPIETHPLR